MQCEKIDIEESSLKIDKDIINDYNINTCINNNIADNNSRFLLLEIKQSLPSLIYENIKLQTPWKNKKLYDGRLVDADFYSLTKEDYERLKRYE